MPFSPSDPLELAKKLRYDLTGCQAKLSELMNMLAALPVPERPAHACPRCGVGRSTAELLAEHLENVHGETAA